jgi:hypothetical protein
VVVPTSQRRSHRRRGEIVIEGRPDTEADLAFVTNLLGWADGVSIALAVLVAALLLFWWAA